MNLFSLKEHTTVTDGSKYARDFQTPPIVCDYIVSLLPHYIKEVLEPTPGEGNLVAAAERFGINVIAPEDYFLLEKRRFEAVITNPPFSAKYAIIENAPTGINKHGMRLGYHILKECMEMSDIVIALMPWFTISDSDVRLRFLKDYGLKSLTALPRKTFKYARIQTVVIELRKGWDKPTQFNVFDRL